MINLITTEKRKSMLFDFYLRFVTVALFFVGISGIIASISMLPAYFSAEQKLKVAEKALSLEKAGAMTPEEVQLLEEVRTVEEKLSLVDSFKNKNYLVSERIIDSILIRKTEEIKIVVISYETDSKGSRSVLVRGEAESRQSLLDFKVSLERETDWEKVDLPVSNFVAGSNISFSLNLTPAK